MNDGSGPDVTAPGALEAIKPFKFRGIDVTMLSTAAHLNGLTSTRLSNAVEERAGLLANIASIRRRHTAFWEHSLAYHLLDYRPSAHYTHLTASSTSC
jgi:hypothetical protein